MLKRTIMSVAVVLLAVSAAQAVLPLPMPGFNFQAQEWDVALANLTALDGGLNSAVSNQFLSWNDNHTLEGAHNASAWQSMVGAITENAAATGESGILLIGQGVLTGGMQVQHVGNGVDPIMQGQGQGLLATSGIQKAGGLANGTANHAIVLTANNNASNLAGTVTESSNIIGVQNQAFSGQPTSAGLVESSMAITTNQQQVMVP